MAQDKCFFMFSSRISSLKEMLKLAFFLDRGEILQEHSLLSPERKLKKEI